MAEFIEREKALEECDWYANEFCECEYAIMPLKGALENLPAADVRPVVLCRDCEYCRRVDEFEYWCDGFCSPARLVRKDDFCSHGCKNE